jgi:hypothetical protein
MVAGFTVMPKPIGIPETFTAEDDEGLWRESPLWFATRL